MPSNPPSRPKPLAFTPPNGAAGFDTRPGVDADHPELQRLRQPQRPRQVAGVDVRRQAVLGRVGPGDRLLLGLERRDRGDRAEDLLHVDRGVGGYVEQHGRRVEVARPVRGLAADQRGRAGLDRVGDQLAHRLHRLLVDERADVHALVLAAAEGERAHPLGELVGELLRHRGLHEEPVRGRAGLAHVPHLGDHRAVHRGVHVGVLEDQERRVAAELHAHPLELLGGLPDQHPADPGRAGEADLAQPVVGLQGLADLRGVAGGHHVEHAVRQPGLGEHRGQRQHRERVCAAGLTTIVQPAATAGPILRVPIASGKFHGVTNRHGPTGFLMVSSRLPPAGACIQRPWIRTASSEYQRKNSAPYPTSPLASATVLPISRLISAAKSSARR